MDTEEGDIFRFERRWQVLDALFRSSREEIQAHQAARLKPVLRYCWDHVPFYRRLWSEAGVHPDDVVSSEDIVKLPTWDKDVQRREIDLHPPFGSYYRSTDARDIAYLLSSGGTTGVPRVFPIMKSDLPGLQDLQARTLSFAGVGPEDVVQVCTHYSAFAGAWCGTWAVEGVGAALVPAGSGRSLPSVRQVELIRAMKVTVLRAQPSYAERLAVVAQEMGLDPAALGVRVLITAGESYSQERRARIEALWGARAYDFFGSSDTFAWSSVDCEHSRQTLGAAGMHVWEDACLVEVLRPDGSRCEPGEYGELTLTTWNWRNSPRIRYRTGDLVCLHEGRCECGRNLVRMSPIRGRVDHVVRLKGVNIYPDALDSVVSRADERIREFYAVAERQDGREVLRVVVEWPEGGDAGVRERVAGAIAQKIGVAATVDLVPPGSTMRTTGVEGDLNKPRRLFDGRAA